MGTPSHARFYFSDFFASYHEVVYFDGQTHCGLPSKSQPYSVEGINAQLRHYLARLRCRFRCFPRSLKALTTAVKLFVFAHDRRQM